MAEYLIDLSGKCNKEIDKRIAIGKESFSKRKILLIKNLNCKLKKRIFKTTIWSVILYACETWTLKQNDINKLEASEMWL